MFGKKEHKAKPLLLLIEEELIRLHKVVKNDPNYRISAYNQISKIHEPLIKMNELMIANLLPERIKSIENTIGELILMGKEEKK